MKDPAIDNIDMEFMRRHFALAPQISRYATDRKPPTWSHLSPTWRPVPPP